MEGDIAHYLRTLHNTEQDASSPLDLQPWSCSKRGLDAQDFCKNRSLIRKQPSLFCQTNGQIDAQILYGPYQESNWSMNMPMQAIGRPRN